jgi:hypothetical protein
MEALSDEERRLKLNEYIRRWRRNNPITIQISNLNMNRKRSPEGIINEKERGLKKYQLKKEMARMRNILLD